MTGVRGVGATAVFANGAAADYVTARLQAAARETHRPHGVDS